MHPKKWIKNATLDTMYSEFWNVYTVTYLDCRYIWQSENLQVSGIKSYPVDGNKTPTLEPTLKAQRSEDFCDVLFMKEN